MAPSPPNRSGPPRTTRASRRAIRTAAARARVLADAGGVLASSLELPVLLQAIARLAVPVLADGCALDLVDEHDVPGTVALAHADPEREALWWEIQNRYPPARNNPPGRYPQVLREGRGTVVAEISDETLAGIAVSPEHHELMRQLGFGSYLLAPLVARERVLGMMVLLRDAGTSTPFAAAEAALAEELARRCALAIDNAQLYAAEQRARRAAERAAERTSRLQAVTAALAASLTPEAVAAVILDQGLAALEARSGAVALVTKDGAGIEIAGTRNLPESYTEHWRYTPLEEPVPMTEVVKTGTPLLFRSREERFERFPALQQGPRPGGEASAVLPLAVEQRVLGSMLLGFGEPRAFDEDEQAFMLALAQQCAQALERARLHQQSAEAAAAIAADRLKTELLSTVSHELRTPLGAIKGFTSMLLEYFEQISGEEARSVLAEIDAAADRLTELVDNLLDLARLESGALAMDRKPVAMADVLTAVVRDAGRRHPDRTIELAAEPNLPPVTGDARRLGQVAANLIENAIKYSPDGGPVAVWVGRDSGGGVRFAVSDHGIGIPADVLGHIFDRFYRVDNERTRAIGGTGLGLAICHGIVTAHGGSITVSSTEGAGSTFTVTLPPG